MVYPESEYLVHQQNCGRTGVWKTCLRTRALSGSLSGLMTGFNPIAVHGNLATISFTHPLRKIRSLYLAELQFFCGCALPRLFVSLAASANYVPGLSWAPPLFLYVINAQNSQMFCLEQAPLEAELVRQILIWLDPMWGYGPGTRSK